MLLLLDAHLKNLDVTESELERPLEFHCREKKFNPTLCKNKHFYALFVSGKAINSFKGLC